MRSIVMQNTSSPNVSKTLLRAGACLMLAASASAGLATVSYAAGLPKEAGVWIDDTGDGAIKIEPCGAKLCGKIVWLKELVNDKGQILMDRHNPDPSLQTRTICGLPVLGQLEALPEGGFDNGWVYDPKEGKSYSVFIEMGGTDRLSVTGYKGVRLLGKTFIWTRAKGELPSCAPTQAVVPSAPAKTGAAAAGSAAGAAAATAKVITPAPRAAAAPAATAGVTPAKPKKPGAAETLPWNTTAKPAVPATAAKAPAGASQLGASALKPAPKKTKVPAKLPEKIVTPQHLEPASQ